MGFNEQKHLDHYENIVSQKGVYMTEYQYWFYLALRRALRRELAKRILEYMKQNS